MRTVPKIGVVFLILGGSALLSSGCGVKGPPLPPFPNTPEKSDTVVAETPIPEPSPTPQATRRKRK